MAPLQNCDGCDGFLPPGASACPHCGHAPGPGRLRKLGRSVLAAAGGGAVAVTLMACYGAAYGPPVQEAEPLPCQATEQDRDGDCSEAAADCDDENPNIRPGVFDAEGDGVDQDCDGADGVAPG